ncbi:hypothetical protein [Flagellimonas marinaquae]
MDVFLLIAQVFIQNYQKLVSFSNYNMNSLCVLHKLIGSNKVKFIKIPETTTILDLIDKKQDIEEFSPS